MQPSSLSTDDNWKMKVMIAGLAVGAAIGLGTAYLLTRTAEESGGGPPKISTADAVKTGIGIFGLMRGIASLGDR